MHIIWARCGPLFRALLMDRKNVCCKPMRLGKRFSNFSNTRHSILEGALQGMAFVRERKSLRSISQIGAKIQICIQHGFIGDSDFVRNYQLEIMSLKASMLRLQQRLRIPQIESHFAKNFLVRDFSLSNLSLSTRSSKCPSTAMVSN